MPHLAFQTESLADLPILPIDEVETAYYLRLRVADEPGVLADITRILADAGISIDAVLQREPAEGENQTDIILLTHRTIEKQVNAGDRAHRGAVRRCCPRRSRIRLEELTELMLYLSHPRRACRARPASPRSCSAAWRPTAAWSCPQQLSADRRADARRPGARLSYPQLAFEIMRRYAGDIDEARSARG